MSSSSSRGKSRSKSIERKKSGAALELRYFPRDEVTFALVAGEDCRGTLVLDNTSATDTYAFRVKTTAPDTYFVRPPMGIVPARSKITIVFAILAKEVNRILDCHSQAVKTGRPPSTDKLLLMSAKVDDSDFSTADEPKELSALWSTSRWKRKTKYDKFLARCFSKVVVSSDSSEDDAGQSDTGALENDFSTNHASDRPPLKSNSTVSTVSSGSSNSATMTSCPQSSPRDTPMTLPQSAQIARGLVAVSPLLVDQSPSHVALRRRSSSNLSAGTGCDADDEQDQFDDEPEIDEGISNDGTKSINGPQGCNTKAGTYEGDGGYTNESSVSPRLCWDAGTGIPRLRENVSQKRRSLTLSPIDKKTFSSCPPPQLLSPSFLEKNHRKDESPPPPLPSPSNRASSSIKSSPFQLDPLSYNPPAPVSPTDESANLFEIQQRYSTDVHVDARQAGDGVNEGSVEQVPEFESEMSELSKSSVASLRKQRHHIRSKMQQLRKSSSSNEKLKTEDHRWDDRIEGMVLYQQSIQRPVTAGATLKVKSVKEIGKRLSKLKKRRGGSHHRHRRTAFGEKLNEATAVNSSSSITKKSSQIRIGQASLKRTVLHGSRPASAPSGVTRPSKKSSGALPWWGAQALLSEKTNMPSENLNREKVDTQRVQHSEDGCDIDSPIDVSAKNIFAESEIVDSIIRLRDRATYLSEYLASIQDVLCHASQSDDSRNKCKVPDYISEDAIPSSITKSKARDSSTASESSDVEELQNLVRRDHNIHLGVKVAAPSLFDSPQTSVSFVEDMVQQVRYSLSKARKARDKAYSMSDEFSSSSYEVGSGYSESTRAIALAWLQAARHVRNSNIVSGKEQNDFPPISSASHNLMFARLQSTRSNLIPYLELLERCATLRNMHNRVAKSMIREQKKISLKLEKISAPLCASPWGIASKAAQKLVEAKRRDAEANKKLKSQSLRSKLKRNMKTLRRLNMIRLCIEDEDVVTLRASGTEMSSGVSLFENVRDCLKQPLWWLEWRCGQLQAEKEFLDSCCVSETDSATDSELNAYRWYVWAGWAGHLVPDDESYSAYVGLSGSSKSLNNDARNQDDEVKLEDLIKPLLVKDVSNSLPLTEEAGINPKSQTPRTRTPRRTNTPRRPDSNGRYHAGHHREIESPHGVKKFFSQTVSVDTRDTIVESGYGYGASVNVIGGATGIGSSIRRRIDRRNYSSRPREIESPHGVRKFFPDHHAEEALSSQNTSKSPQHLFYAVSVEGKDTETNDYAVAAQNYTELPESSQTIDEIHPHEWSSGLFYDANVDIEYPGDDDECGYANGYWYQVSQRYNDKGFFKQFFWWQQVHDESQSSSKDHKVQRDLGTTNSNGDITYENNERSMSAASRVENIGISLESMMVEESSELLSTGSDLESQSFSKADDDDYDQDYVGDVVEFDLVVRAMADYERRDETELSLREGELIKVIRQHPSGWWSGCKENDSNEGIVGWFPSNFVHEKHLIWALEEEEDEDSAFPESLH